MLPSGAVADGQHGETARQRVASPPVTEYRQAGLVGGLKGKTRRAGVRPYRQRLPAYRGEIEKPKLTTPKKGNADDTTAGGPVDIECPVSGQLIDRVWGADYVGDTKTLDVHVKRLRAKVELDPGAPKHLVTVRGLGYKFEA